MKKKKRIEMIEKYSSVNLISDCLDSIIIGMDKPAVPGIIPTGFDILDRYINGGLHPGTLLTIAARPHIGKTSFVVSMIRNMIRDGKKILFFSLQSSSYEISSMLIAGISRIPLRHIECMRIHGDDNEFSRVMDAANYLYCKSFHIVDMPMVTMEELRKIARTAIETGQLDCLLIDGINRIDMKADSSADRYRKIAGKLKKLAIELKIPVVATMRYPRDRKERMPSAAYVFPKAKFIMRESDIFLFLHRKRVLSEVEREKNVKDSDGKATLQVTKVIVAKQRNGVTGNFKVGYNAATTSFENIVQSAYFVEP